MWQYIGFGIVVAVIIAGVIYNILRTKKINEQGVETSGVVSRIEETDHFDGETHTTQREYFVTYTTNTGERVEAVLGNPPRHTREGDTLRIKYLPEKPKFVRAIKEN